MTADDTFNDVMARLRAGSDDAARTVFRRFANRLIGLARIHLDGRMRAKVDPEDVLQSVYRSFFVQHGAGQLELEGAMSISPTGEDLWVDGQPDMLSPTDGTPRKGRWPAFTTHRQMLHAWSADGKLALIYNSLYRRGVV